MFEAEALPLFYQIAALLILAAGLGFLGHSLRQPLIVSYVVVGLLAGPSVLGLTHIGAHIELLAELGVTVLLFLVGLKLDVALVRSVGLVALATGLGQVAFTAIAGFALCLALGLPPLTSAYVAVALTFSSTIIIVKLLSDKGEVNALHGRIALGFLIVQDVVVVLAMVVLSTLGLGDSAETAPRGVLTTLGAMAALLLMLGVFVRYVADGLVERMAQAPELLVAFALGWATLLATLGDYLGFGKELGGLLAGVSLASTPFRDAMSSRLTSLRDFLLLFFFIALGARLDLGALGADVAAAVLLSLFVLIGNPLIVLAIMGALGYRKRTGFLAGLTVAQISEFSLIFMAMGLSLGHVDDRAVGLVTLVGLITIAASVYMILYSHTLYAWLAPALTPFERAAPAREPDVASEAPRRRYDVVLFGLGRYGGAIARRLRDAGVRTLGVDFSPAAVRTWEAAGIDIVYGDMSDTELVESLPLQGARWVVSAVPEHDLGLTHTDPRLALLQTLQGQGYRGRTAIAAHSEASIESLEANGADLILMPFRDAAERAAELLASEAQPAPELELLDPDPQREFDQSA